MNECLRVALVTSPYENHSSSRTAVAPIIIQLVLELAQAVRAG